MSVTRGRSFVEVICEKYSPENFPYRRGMGIGIHIAFGPQGSPVKARLNLPAILVLDGCGINTAGEETDIAAFCSHVCELDLSNNNLQDWYEISKIVSNLANLTFLNLTSNSLTEARLDSKCAASFSRIQRLVLNNTKVSWEIIHTFLQELPRLEELFLCLNDYRTVLLSPCSYPSLRLLHITDNNLTDWAELHKLGQMFPGLDTLILANNPLTSIVDSQETLARLFPNLRSINLHNSGLSSWDDIDKLKAFPKLEEVRLLGIALLQNYSEEERRKLVIARLPSIILLNGSKVAGERIDAERFLIRYYIKQPDDDLPERFFLEMEVLAQEISPLGPHHHTPHPPQAFSARVLQGRLTPDKTSDNNGRAAQERPGPFPAPEDERNAGFMDKKTAFLLEIVVREMPWCLNNMAKCVEESASSQCGISPYGVSFTLVTGIASG